MTTTARRSRGMSKKERERFRLLVLGHIASLPRPNRPRTATHRDHEIDTPLGPLGISLHADGDIVSVHCAFEYPRVAAAVFGAGSVNEHSGKWNFYYGKGWTGAGAFKAWKCALDQVLGVTWKLPG